MAMGQFRRLPILLFFLAMFSPFSIAELPQELDPFLERLFETTECEKFLADGSFLAVATRECPPNRCEFPHQLCMRPSAEYQKEEANQCRALPEACLLAANGGQPLPAPSPTTSPALTVDSQSPPPPPPQPQPAPQPVDRPAVEKPPQPTATLAPNIQVGNIRPQPPPPPSPTSHSHGPICEQGPPEGRFCGFSLKFAYNRETRSCDQFWFPGCRTERTNENLFDTFAQCLQASRHCARADPIFRPQPSMVQRPSPPDSTAFGGGGNGQFLGGGSQLPPPSPQQSIGPIHQQTGQPETPFGQAGQFLRLITNTIREVRERGNGATSTGNGQQQGGGGGGGGGFRFDPSQLGGILQSLGGRRK